MRFVAALAVGVAAVLALTGCSAYYFDERSDPISDAEVVGTWIASSGDGESATLEFAGDGTVHVDGVPVDPTADWMDVEWSGERVAGDGTWSVVETDVATWHVETAIDGRRLSLMAITTDDEGLCLVLPLGDPDMKTRVTFVRVDDPR